MGRVLSLSGALPAAVTLALASTALADDFGAHGHGVVSFPITARHGGPLVSRRNISKRQLASDTVGQLSGTLYTINVQLGTPGQTVAVKFDTGSSEMWVNPVCEKSDAPAFCHAQSQFTMSSTFVNLGVEGAILYDPGYVDFVYGSDYVGIGTARITQQIFGVAYDSSNQVTGVLGAAPNLEGWSSSYPFVIDSLYAQRLIQSKTFSVDLRGVSTGGSVIFGGIDTKKFQGTLAKLPVIPAAQSPDGYTRWWVALDGISVTQPDGQSSPVYTKPGGGSGQSVVLDSGSTLCALPTAIFTQLLAAFPGSAPVAGGMHTVDCSLASEDVEGSVDFTFGEKVISVPFSHFIHRDPTDAGVCYLGAVDAASAGSLPTLGDTFLRGAYAVFDWTNTAVHLAQSNECGSEVVAIPDGADSISGITGGCAPPVVSSSAVPSSSIAPSSSVALSSSVISSSAVVSSSAQASSSSIVSSSAFVSSSSVASSSAADSSSVLSSSIPVSSAPPSSSYAASSSVAPSSSYDDCDPEESEPPVSSSYYSSMVVSSSMEPSSTPLPSSSSYVASSSIVPSSSYDDCEPEESEPPVSSSYSANPSSAPASSTEVSSSTYPVGSVSSYPAGSASTYPAGSISSSHPAVTAPYPVETQTYTSTQTYTVTSCPPSITDCPAGGYVTSTVVTVTTAVCSQTTGTYAITIGTSVATVTLYPVTGTEVIPIPSAHPTGISGGPGHVGGYPGSESDAEYPSVDNSGYPGSGSESEYPSPEDGAEYGNGEGGGYYSVAPTFSTLTASSLPGGGHGGYYPVPSGAGTGSNGGHGYASGTGSGLYPTATPETEAPPVYVSAAGEQTVVGRFVAVMAAGFFALLL